MEENIEEIRFKQGIHEGIKFAAARFLGHLPSDVYDQVFDKTVEFIFKECYGTY